jgi:hypothetical protein
LLFWDRDSGEHALLEHTDLLPEQAIMSLAPLADGRLVAGSTTSPGTGGEKKATEAELCILDLGTRALTWHSALFPGAQGYTDLCPLPNGRVLGLVDRTTFFVFDPGSRAVVHTADLSRTIGPCVSHQGPRAFVRDGDAVYILAVKGIGVVDPETYAVTLLAESPVSIGAGGDILGGRLYFAHGSHIYSWALPAR